MISTTPVPIPNMPSKEQVMNFVKNNSVKKMKDMLAFFVWLYIFGGLGLYLDKLEAIFYPEVKKYFLGRVVLFYVYISIMIVLNAYTFPIIYNIPEYKSDLLNWGSNTYDTYRAFNILKDDFHKKLHQFTKNKEL